MKLLQRKSIYLAFGFAGGLTLAAIAVVGYGYLASKRTTVTPKIVDIIISKESSRKTLQVRDPVAIVVLQSILTGGPRVPRKPPAHSEYQVFIHPTDQMSYSVTPGPVWRRPDGRFAWHHDGHVTELNGSLTDFIEWMRIRRLNQLRRAPDPRQRKLAEQQRDITLQESVESLLRIANSTNAWFAKAALREVVDLVSVESVPMTDDVPGELKTPNRRAIADPNRRIRDGLLGLVNGAAGDVALQCLQQIGDRATADALVPLLKQHQQDPLGEPLMRTVERLYGLPATYERFGICGNSTAEEMAEYARLATEQQAAAIDDLLAWQGDHAGASDDAFYDAVLLRWSEMLIHIAQSPDPNSYQHDRTPAGKLMNLLGLGSPVVPAMKRRQKTTTAWQESALLAFCIAYLTDECDAEDVTKLLDGDLVQQRIACCIISAAANPAWNEQVAALLRTPLPDQRVDDVVALRDVAAQALYCPRGVTALPTLQAAFDDGFESQMILQILKHFAVPEAQF